MERWALPSWERPLALITAPDPPRNLSSLLIWAPSQPLSPVLGGGDGGTGADVPSAGAALVQLRMEAKRECQVLLPSLRNRKPANGPLSWEPWVLRSAVAPALPVSLHGGLAAFHWASRPRLAGSAPASAPLFCPRLTRGTDSPAWGGSLAFQPVHHCCVTRGQVPSLPLSFPSTVLGKYKSLVDHFLLPDALLPLLVLRPLTLRWEICGPMFKVTQPFPQVFSCVCCTRNKRMPSGWGKITWILKQGWPGVDVIEIPF